MWSINNKSVNSLKVVKDISKVLCLVLKNKLETPTGIHQNNELSAQSEPLKVVRLAILLSDCIYYDCCKRQQNRYENITANRQNLSNSIESSLVAPDGSGTVDEAKNILAYMFGYGYIIIFYRKVPHRKFRSTSKWIWCKTREIRYQQT